MPSTSPLWIVSNTYTLHDYEVLLDIIGDTKHVKRESRYNAIRQLMNLPTNIITPTMHNQNANFGPIYDKKQEVKAFLTAISHHRSKLYRATTMITSEISRVIGEDAFLGPLLHASQIMVLVKGSQAQKICLKAHFQDHSEQIDHMYGIDGDNDISIMIDPTLANFNQVHNDVCACVKRVLRLFRHTDDCRRIETFLHNIFDDTLYELSGRRDFVMEGSADAVPIEEGIPHLLFISHAKKWEFRNGSFALIRFMASYTHDGHRVSSELLDVSIPYPADKTLDDYKLFRYGTYAHKFTPLTFDFNTL